MYDKDELGEIVEYAGKLDITAMLAFDLTKYMCVIFGCDAYFRGVFILIVFSPSGRKLEQYCFVSCFDYIRHTSMYLWNGRLYMCGMNDVAKLLRF